MRESRVQDGEICVGDGEICVQDGEICGGTASRAGVGLRMRISPSWVRISGARMQNSASWVRISRLGGQ